MQRTDFNQFVSPVTGGGFQESGGRIAQLFLDAMHRGKRLPAEMALHAWEIFQLQGIEILNQGKPLASPEEAVATLQRQATVFLDKQLPILEALQIA